MQNLYLQKIVKFELNLNLIASKPQIYTMGHYDEGNVHFISTVCEAANV